eukprot:1823110-Amphidinium_carterae.1
MCGLSLCNGGFSGQRLRSRGPSYKGPVFTSEGVFIKGIHLAQGLVVKKGLCLCKWGVDVHAWLTKNAFKQRMSLLHVSRRHHHTIVPTA